MATLTGSFPNYIGGTLTTRNLDTVVIGTTVYAPKDVTATIGGGGAVSLTAITASTGATRHVVTLKDSAGAIVARYRIAVTALDTDLAALIALGLTEYVADEVQQLLSLYATSASLAAHTGSTNVHGIANTALLTGAVVYADAPTGTNDQLKIAAALAALPASGGTVLLQPGTYVVSYTGTFSSDGISQPYAVLVGGTAGGAPIVLRGAGIDATTIQLANAQPTSCITLLVRGAGSSANKRTARTRIEDLTVDGNKAGQSASVDFSALNVAYTDDPEFVNVHVKNGHKQGMQVYRDSQRARVINCTFSGSNNAQLRFESHNPVAAFNKINASGGSVGIQLMVNADIDTPSRDALVAYNEIERYRIGVEVWGCQGTEIVGNQLINGTQGDATNQCAVFIQPYIQSGTPNRHAWGIRVRGNYIQNNRRGIIVQSSGAFNVRDCEISGNVILEGQTGDPFGNVQLVDGIREINTAGNNERILITDNTISGATTPLVWASPTVKIGPHYIDGVRLYENATALQGFPVAATTPTTSHALVWNGSQWEPQAQSGGGGASIVAEGRAKRGTTADWIVPGVAFIGATSRTLTAGRIWYEKMLVSTAITVDGLVLIDVITAAASAELRVGIYSADVDWQPVALIYDAGVIDLSATGQKILAFGAAQTLAAGRYLLANLSNTGTAALRCYTGIMRGDGLVPGGGANAIRAGMFAAQTYGALPSSPPAWTGDGAGSAPFIHSVFCRVSTP